MAGESDDETDFEMRRIYWQAQWDRIGRLETNRLQVSNFVVAASIVALGLNVGAKDLPTAAFRLIAAAVAACNALVIWYCDRTERSIRMHQDRSNLLLSENWPYLYDLRLRVGPETRLIRLRRSGDIGSGRYGWTLVLQQGVHFVIFAAALGLALAVH
jgi:hypothetical protein